VAWREALSRDVDEVDPTFATVSEIARQQGVSEMTIYRFVRLHPERVEIRTIWRRGSVKVYRLKDAA